MATENNPNRDISSVKIFEFEYKKLPKDYSPIVIDISQTMNDDFINNPKLGSDITMSRSFEPPKSALGYHRYIHINKDEMSFMNSYREKKQKEVFHVMNKFERYIDNYDDSIGSASKKFFGLEKDKPDILSRGFYKLWEILQTYKLIDINNKNFVSAHLAEGPGSFIQATMFYRDTYSKYSKNDKYYAVTLHPEETDGHVPELEAKFTEYYANENPKRFILHKTYSKNQMGGYKDRDNGDLTNPITIELFGGQLTSANDRADFITADGGFNWKNENTQEQEAHRLIFSEILAAIDVQKTGGSFVCKFFESYTMVSCKLLYLLTQMYEKVLLIKPLTSRPSNSEKYVVCMNFKLNTGSKEYEEVVKNLKKILKFMHSNVDKYVSFLWNYVKLPKSFINTMIYANITIANKSVEAMTRLRLFHEAQNFYGDVYQENRLLQIEAAKYWNKVFLATIENKETVNGYLSIIANNIIQKNIEHVKANFDKLV